ncbi:MAG: DAK2 domain-containing protein [Chloroflexi bacterium]|nr:DAK2 domain-containing protein [Chloroflexota bacterium]
MPPRKLARLDGSHLKRMIAGATAMVAANVEQVNALNVFPVPDGDTGTNMHLTIREVAAAAHKVAGGSASDVAKEMASRALREARGNSGVILSQFFKGVAQGLEGLDDFGANDWARCLRLATEHSYKAVGNPVEGTMLTVIREAAEKAEEQASRSRTVVTLLDKVCAQARDAVKRTPTMLEVLRQAGVVDAGGYGLFLVLEGARRELSGEEGAPKKLSVPGMGKVDGVLGKVAEEFLEHSSYEMYGFCTQFLITDGSLDVDEIRAAVETMAKSTVVVGDAKAVKVHGHTENPDALVAYGESLGTLSQVSVQDMDEQKQGFTAMHRERPAEKKAIGLVVVASGDGLRKLFESLGADVVVSGGDTMNPSVQDIADAVAACPSDTVVVLPNNKNIVTTARQACEVCDKAVLVVPSVTIPQGVSAVLNYSQQKSPEANAADMERALGDVRSVAVTDATRSVELNGVQVELGQKIGLVDGEVVTAGEDVVEVLTAALTKAEASEDALVTLYRGAGRSEAQGEKDAAALREAFPEAEFETVYGGQAHYYYLASVE